MCCFDFHYNFCVKHFSIKEKFSEIISQIHIALHTHYSYQILMRILWTEFYTILKYQIS